MINCLDARKTIQHCKFDYVIDRVGNCVVYLTATIGQLNSCSGTMIPIGYANTTKADYWQEFCV